MRFKYNAPFLYDSLNPEFKIEINSRDEGVVLKDMLNSYEGTVNYQGKVIDKCLKNEKKYKTMIIDKDYTIKVLVNEKKILKKIILEDKVC